MNAFLCRKGRSLSLILVLLLAAGCDRPLGLQVVLDADESIGEGAPVFVDTALAGRVEHVGNEGGERVANLSITDEVAREHLRVGTVRIRESGRIQLRTETVAADAAPLPHGARVPTNSSMGYLVRKYSRGATLTTIGGALAAIMLLGGLFRSLVSTIGLVISVALSGVVTQMAHPYIVPIMSTAMDRLGPPPVNASPAPSAAVPPPASPPAGSGLPDLDSLTGGTLQRAEGTIREVMSTRPSPEVLTWCVVFTVCFIGFNLILGKASRAWRT